MATVKDAPDANVLLAGYVALQAREGFTHRYFCQHAGLAESTFCTWRRRASLRSPRCESAVAELLKAGSIDAFAKRRQRGGAGTGDNDSTYESGGSTKGSASGARTSDEDTDDDLRTRFRRAQARDGFSLAEFARCFSVDKGRLLAWLDNISLRDYMVETAMNDFFRQDRGEWAGTLKRRANPRSVVLSAATADAAQHAGPVAAVSPSAKDAVSKYFRQARRAVLEWAEHALAWRGTEDASRCSPRLVLIDGDNSLDALNTLSCDSTLAEIKGLPGVAPELVHVVVFCAPVNAGRVRARVDLVKGVLNGNARLVLASSDHKNAADVQMTAMASSLAADLSDLAAPTVDDKEPAPVEMLLVSDDAFVTDLAHAIEALGVPCKPFSSYYSHLGVLLARRLALVKPKQLAGAVDMLRAVAALSDAVGLCALPARSIAKLHERLAGSRQDTLAVYQHPLRGWIEGELLLQGLVVEL